MRSPAAELASRLARDAEAVCRYYLSNGHREGRYWVVGDVANTRGQSLYVRLTGPERGPGAAGKWTDAATGQHGDLLDLIALNGGFDTLANVLEEARRFLLLPRPEPRAANRPAAPGSTEAARRLFAMGRPIGATLADTYLRARGLASVAELGALRFHPRCYHHAGAKSQRSAWPAMLAAVTDFAGQIRGVQRTWLDPSGKTKAPLKKPRKAMGELQGHAVRFGAVADVLAAGEGIETVLSLRTALPTLPVVAALSAAHLGALLLPSGLRRLYVLADNDRAGDEAVRRISARVSSAGIQCLIVRPVLEDLNSDLCRLGPLAISDLAQTQILREDLVRFGFGGPQPSSQ